MAAALPLKLFQHLVDGERHSLLAWRKFSESLEKICHDGLRGKEQKNVVQHPVQLGNANAQFARAVPRQAPAKLDCAADADLTRVSTAHRQRISTQYVAERKETGQSRSPQISSCQS